TSLKGRVRGQVVSRTVVVVTRVSMTGEGDVLGCAVGDTETEAFWAEFFRSLRARGLAGRGWSSPTTTTPSRPPSPNASLAPPGGFAGPSWAARARQSAKDQRGDGRRRHPHHLRPAHRR